MRKEADRLANEAHILRQAADLLDRKAAPQDTPTPVSTSRAKTTAKVPMKASKRARTAKALAKIAKRSEPMSPEEAHSLLPNVGVLAAHGYVKKSNGGYVRTDKVFTV